MAKREKETDRVKHWQDRLATANRVYDKWEARFRCKRLVNYYLGEQWAGLTEDEAQTKYTINMVFPTIEITLPSLLFYNPTVKVAPRPAHADDLNSEAQTRAKLIEDTVQTFIDKPDVHFKLQTLLAVRDAEFRFGVMEVGYTADWVDNPNAGKPMLKEDDEPMEAEGAPIAQPAQTLEGEQLYVKRIPPQCCRVSVSGRNVTSDNDWFAYYEWHYLEDVKANKSYRNTANLKPGGELRDHPSTTVDDPSREQHAGMIKLWKIWDLRQQVKHVIADGGEKFLLEAEPVPYFPIAVLKYFEIPDEWYPLPPVFNWLSPQDELNETREMQKVHRRRFTRRYTYRDGAIDPAELEKLEAGGDGVYGKANQDNPIQVVPDAPLDPGNTVEQVGLTQADFYQISGTGAEARGDAQSETATQANIIETRGQIRESKARMDVAEWLGQIARLMFLCIREHMQLPFVIQIHHDPFAIQTDPASVLQTAQTWQEITASALSEADFDVSIDVASLSPVSEQQQAQQWMQVLALLQNPTLTLILGLSQPLLRKTLGYLGIKNEREIAEISKVLQVMGMVQQAGAGSAEPGAPVQPGAGQKGQPAGIPQRPAGIQ